MLKSRVDRLAAEPEDLETLVEAITLYHMVIEGMLALTGQHFIIEYNESVGTLPGFVEGFDNVARDEHRHVAFGARFLRDMAERDPRYAEAIQRTLVECGPAADGVLQPPWAEEGDRPVRREHRGDPGVRDEGARPPAEGDRAHARRLAVACETDVALPGDSRAPSRAESISPSLASSACSVFAARRRASAVVQGHAVGECAIWRCRGGCSLSPGTASPNCRLTGPTPVA